MEFELFLCGAPPLPPLSSSRFPGLWLPLLLLPVAAYLVQEGIPLPRCPSAVGGGPATVGGRAERKEKPVSCPGLGCWWEVGRG